MSGVDNLRDTVVPKKSDQLNADDLIGTTKTITVSAVKRGDTEQPVSIHYDGENGRPYKPCKSMRRVLIAAWGDDGRKWVGRSMTLYNDPEVMFGGVKVGGIRISHVSDIPESMVVNLTTTRSKRKPFRVDPLILKSKPSVYPDDQFSEKFPAMKNAIETGKMTHEQVIARLEKTAPISDDQRNQINEVAVQTEPTEEEDSF